MKYHLFAEYFGVALMLAALAGLLGHQIAIHLSPIINQVCEVLR